MTWASFAGAKPPFSFFSVVFWPACSGSRNLFIHELSCAWYLYGLLSCSVHILASTLFLSYIRICVPVLMLDSSVGRTIIVGTISFYGVRERKCVYALPLS